MTKQDLHITPETTIGKLLEKDQEQVIDALIKLNSNFSRLRNRLLRNLFARRVTIADACQIARCDVSSFLNSMKAIGFVIDETIIVDEQSPAPVDMIDFNRQTKVLELDVRPFLERNTDPLKEILRLASRLQPGERLKIISPFIPVPLLSVLEGKGFLSHTDGMEPNLFLTWFEKINKQENSLNTEDEVPENGHLPEISNVEQGSGDTGFNEILHRYTPDKVQYIDVRELEMPGPMLRIMEGLDNLPDDNLLYVYHKKVPAFLLPELHKRGLKFLLQQHHETRVDLLIYKPWA
ncbi:DUF2249 domain-containing protein [Pedobacter sp. AW31-3R]|uniref:DUF2249 domain-containing protein n=1 Tax=Pedobacter sp. AW31-3R TaxID=3445781 RepID=UPI003F9FA27C